MGEHCLYMGTRAARPASVCWAGPWSCLPLGRAVPGRAIVLTSVRTVLGRPTVPSHRSRHSPIPGPGRHGPDSDQAVLCLGRAKIPYSGLGHRASGLMANYSSIPLLPPPALSISAPPLLLASPSLGFPQSLWSFRKKVKRVVVDMVIDLDH